MRCVFAGTPDVAAVALADLLGSRHDVVAVITRPDAQAGRGRAVAASPVAMLARDAGIEVLQPSSLRDPDVRARLGEIAPDVAPIVAYGGLVPPAALTIPAHGWVNLHFSLLPAWRGAAPVQHAIWRGDDVTGASTFALEEGLDTGPVYGILTEAIRPDDTSGALLERLARAGSGLLIATLDAIESGDAHPVPQTGEASFAPKITADDARVRWDLPAIGIDRQVRACTPVPGAWTTCRGERLGVGPVTVTEDDDLAPGQLRVGKRDVEVGTATRTVRLGAVRPAGKREMPAAGLGAGRATDRRGRPVMTDKPRAAALELLRTVREDDAYANLVLPQLLHGFGLSGRDAAFATELAYGTLRGKGWYDAVLSSCVTRPWDKVEPALQDVLRMGAHQILSMRVPDHAAVDSSCVLARGLGTPPGAAARAGFVNAVLRKVAAADTEAWARRLQGERADDDVEWLATRYSHPGWIVRAARDALGTRRGELPELLAADNAPARPSLVARPGRMSVDELVDLPEVEPGRWSPIAGTLVDGTPDMLACVRDGRAGVQDEGSQLVALALARAEVADDAGLWLDACAGPGGKAALLDGLAHERGGHLVAVEQHAHRAVLVEGSFAPGSTSLVLTGDARRAPWGDRLFDRVLIDAPCTGLGALRRRPESRWRRTTADLAALGAVQRDLLRAGIQATRPGGVIAYVTCSPHLAETEFVVSDVLRGRTDVVQEDARPLLPEITDVGDGPGIQMWPHRHGTDGMYLALLRRQ